MTNPISIRALGAILAAAIAAPAWAQELQWGSKAPALSIEEWLKGEEVTSFEAGRTYVLDFWATWHSSSQRTIPLLTELKKKHADSKLTVIGVASSERQPTVEAQRAALAKFIEEKADAMVYSIAFDADRSMTKTWSDPAAQPTFSACFVVDGTGTIAWIGSPLALGEPLAKIVAGKWDVKAEWARETRKRELIRKAELAENANDWDAALTSLDEAIRLGDDVLREVARFKYRMLLQKKDFDGAFAFIDKHLKGALKDEADLLNSIAWSLVDPGQAEVYAKKDCEFALRCAVRACEVVKGKADEPKMLDTLAAVHFAKGDNAKAVEVQTRAVELTKGQRGAEMYQQKLETYKQAGTK